MTKRQAKIIAQLTTASQNAGADFWQNWVEHGLSEAECTLIQQVAERMAWEFLERHGFINAPSIPGIVAYAKANY